MQGTQAPPTGCFWSQRGQSSHQQVQRGGEVGGSDRHQAECEFSREPEAPPTPSALPGLLPAPLLLLVFPGILPGTRPSDVLPLVQVGILHLLQREDNRRRGGKK